MRTAPGQPGEVALAGGAWHLSRSKEQDVADEKTHLQQQRDVRLAQAQEAPEAHQPDHQEEAAEAGRDERDQRVAAGATQKSGLDELAP